MTQPRAKNLMILGTASGVGKSFLTAGFCRLFSDWGYKVAPFKAQNMSNNSYVTEESGEIGRAQAVQAECARVVPSVDMNPILLKPAEDNLSQVIVHGKPIGHFKARDYFSRKEIMKKAVEESYNRLAETHEIIVIEGAGSVAEVNLKEYDLVNMFTAVMADAACLLVADIDRGGVFASLIGTLDLLEPSQRERIHGLLINKFRGDVRLFDEGIRFLEERTGKRVLGVLPYQRDIWIEEEDSLPIHSPLLHPPPQAGEERGGGLRDDIRLDIAVIRLPRMSNFTDFEVFKHEPGVQLRYIQKASEIRQADLVILPGTKSTLADLLYLREHGFESALQTYVSGGGRLLGICGGYQMMGEWILDPTGIESQNTKYPGFGFFQMTTEFGQEKILKRISEKIQARIFGQDILVPVEAYEIHMGKTQRRQFYQPFGKEGAVDESGAVAGTYYHGLFDHGSFRQAFLNALANSAGKAVSFSPDAGLQQIKELHYEKLKNFLEAHVDLDFLKSILNLQPKTVKL